MASPKFQQSALDSVVSSLDTLIDALGQDVSDAVLSGGSNVNELKNALDALQGVRGVLAGLTPGAVTVNVGVQS